MSERHLIRCLKNLEDLGELTMIRGNGRGRLTTYQIKVGEAERVTKPSSFTEPERVTDPVERVTDTTPFTEPERVTDLVKRVTNPAERVTNPVIKGDKSGNTYKEEPSWNHEETMKKPNGALAPTVAADQPEPQISNRGGKKPSAKKPKPPKSQFHNHPSVVAYRDILGFYQLNAAQADLIAEATGTEIELAPAEWLRFLREIAQTGNKHTHNVRVMVAAFGHYKANVSLAKALSMAWDEAQGRQGGLFNATAPVSDQRTTEELGIRDCRVL